MSKKQLALAVPVVESTPIPEIPVYCSYSKMERLDKLIPHPRNYNNHPAEQIRMLAKAIAFSGWRYPIKISKRSGFIISGHARMAAAILLHQEYVPIDEQEYQDEVAELVDLLADNRIAELAVSDEKMEKDIISDLDSEMGVQDMEVAGYSDEYLEELLSPVASEGPSHKIFSREEILNEAFHWLRDNGFPFPTLQKLEMMQEINRLSQLPLSDCRTSRLAYRVADTYNKHRFEASAVNMSSPVESFGDDKKLKKAIAMKYDETGSIESGFFGYLTMVSGTQACSNFRPGFARWVYETYCPEGGIVFDSSTGYGGRLVGFMASHCSCYIGTDPNVKTYQANDKLCSEVMPDGKKAILHNEPIEDLQIESYLGGVDCCFTSPPYFIKEQYSDSATQSCVRYPEYDSWIDGFLKPMIEKNFSVLKSGGAFILNIEDVKVKGKSFDLVEPSIELSKNQGFSYQGIKEFPLGSRIFMKDGEKNIEESSESVLIFKKQ